MHSEFKHFIQNFGFYCGRVGFFSLKIDLQKSVFVLILSTERNILPELVAGSGMCQHEHHEVAVGPFLSLSRSVCMEALPSSILTISHTLVRNLLRVHSILPSM